MRKYIIFFIALLALFAISCSSKTMENKFYYHIENDGIVIESYMLSRFSDELIIPDYFVINNKEYPVIKIDDYAFYNNNFFSVKLPIFLKELGEFSFASNENLEEVTIGENIKEIGSHCFQNCVKLKKINFDAIECNDFESNNNIFANVGTDVGGFEIIIGQNVKKIPSYFVSNNFTKLTTLNKIDFSKSQKIESIGEFAFENCDELKEIEIPLSVRKIGKSAFKNCFGVELVIYNSEECDDLTSGDYAFENVGRNAGAYELFIGENVNHIPAYLFENNTLIDSYLNRIEIADNNSLISIRKYSFANCNRLWMFPYMHKLENIEEGAFTGDISLSLGYFPNTLKYISDIAFGQCDNLVEIYNLSGYSITDNNSILQSINSFVIFEHLDLNESMYQVYDKDFVKVVYNGTNYVCGVRNKQPELNLGDIFNGQKYSIYHAAFYKNTNITSVTIGEYVNQIESYAFYKCPNLYRISFFTTDCSILNYAFTSDNYHFMNIFLIMEADLVHNGIAIPNVPLSSVENIKNYLCGEYSCDVLKIEATSRWPFVPSPV